MVYYEKQNFEFILTEERIKMDDGGPTASIFFFVVLLFIDMFFYGFGADIDSLNEKEIERRAEEDKDKKSVRLKAIISNPTEYINTVQLITP